MNEIYFQDSKGPIEELTWGRFVICGVEHAKGINAGKNIRLIGETVSHWAEYKTGKDHFVDVSKIIGIHGKEINTLIIGIGIDGLVQIDPSVEEYVKQKLGIEKLIVARTAEACKIYNELFHQQEKIALLAHSTC